MSKHKKKDAKCKLVVDTNPIQIIEEEEVKLTRGDSGEHQVNTIDERTNFKKKIITSKNCSNKNISMQEEDKQQINIDNSQKINEEEEHECQRMPIEINANRDKIRNDSIHKDDSQNNAEAINKDPFDLSEQACMKENYKINTINFFKDLPKENYLVNCYAIPRGLTSGQRVRVMSESEKFFEDRYSKKAIEEIKVKNRNTVLGRTHGNIGFKGGKLHKTHRIKMQSQNDSKETLQQSNSMKIIRPATMQRAQRNHGINTLLLNMNVPVTDKHGRELFPDFSITPWNKELQIDNTKNCTTKRPETVNIEAISSRYIEKIANQDMNNIRKPKHRSKIKTHKYIEDQEIHEEQGSPIKLSEHLSEENDNECYQSTNNKQAKKGFEIIKN